MFRVFLVCAVTLGVATAADAHAQPAASIPSVDQVLSGAAQGRPADPVAPKAATVDRVSAILGGSTQMAPQDLGATSAGSNTVLYGAVTDQTLAATNTGNQLNVAGNLANGALTVQSNAFGGFNGVGNFIMNTGNQNNLQGSLNVTIIMAPPAN